MPNRSRDRQLAKLAQRRQAERRAARRRRNLAIGLAVGGLALALLIAGAVILFDDDDPVTAAPPSSSAGASATADPSASPSGEPGTKTGTVTPEAPASDRVACGADAPANADRPKPQFAGPPPVTIDPTTSYGATIETSCGTIEVELFAKDATDAVNSFVFLANEGFFDGQSFHRVVGNFVIQGGDPLGTGTGGPGYEFPVTVTDGVSFDAAGLLAYAHSQVGGNGSQFFITLGPAANLDPPQGQYTIFGRVTKGQDVVDTIGALPVGEADVPDRAVFIESVTVAES